LDTPSASVAGRRGSLLLAALLILTGFSINHWSIGWTFSADGFIDGAGIKRGILAGQVALWVLAAVALWRRPRGVLVGVLSLVLAVISALGLYRTTEARSTYAKVADQRAILLSINHSEDLLQWINPDLRHLSSDALNLELPGERGSALFADELTFYDVAGPDETHAPDELGGGLAHVHHWNVNANSETSALENAELWRPLFERVEYFEHAKFYFVKGLFQDDEESRFETEMGFAGLARLTNGQLAHASAKVKAVWTDHTELFGEKDWRIREWKTVKLELVEAEAPLYAEVLDRVVPDRAERARAQRSIHEEKVVALIRDKQKQHKHFLVQATDRHPGISIVDIDRDGFDDFYLMARWGKNMLFRNRGDGTFEEIAAELGLDYEDHTSCAIFADFDNDGDDDAFLGRTLARSLYLENEDGHFVDRSDEFETPLPFLVASVAAADYDGDGLLDVYFSTYAVRLMLGQGGLPDQPSRKRKNRDRYLAEFLPEHQAKAMFEGYHKTENRNSDRFGPPNVLVHNRGGGRFEAATSSANLEVWRNSFQATWADYDGDGDVDIYVANDYAPNNLLRNDGGTFVDVSIELGAEDIGFGMGASFGDYDNDGAQDLYVSNMFSKAGLRITSQIAELDPTLNKMARGNSLLDFDGERFTKVSALSTPGLLVEKAGWSWGSQFVDFNNDGFLDILALSGQYTAPEQIAIPFDR
jgi:hypothetical protein